MAFEAFSWSTFHQFLCVVDARARFRSGGSCSKSRIVRVILVIGEFAVVMELSLCKCLN